MGIFRPYEKTLNKGYGGLAHMGTVQALKELWQHGVVTELYKGTWLTMTSLGVLNT